MRALKTITPVKIAAIFCILSFSLPSRANTSRETTYRYNQLWSAAVRFLRVDNGFSVTEQDKETGYILFEYKEAGRTCIGAMELFPKEQNGTEIIALKLSIQDMPTYVETVLMDKLVRKLRDEYGVPPAPRRIRNEQKKNDSKSKTDEEDASRENTDDKIDNDDAR